MANLMLLQSSIACGAIHFIALVCVPFVPLYFEWMILMGIFTSVWNHATTCAVAKKTDRFMMIIGITIDLYMLIPLNDKKCTVPALLLFGSIVLYFVAKISRNDSYHAFAHVVLTLTHLLILQNFPY